MNIDFINFGNSIIIMLNEINDLTEKEYEDPEDLKHDLVNIVNSNIFATIGLGFGIILQKIKALCELANKTQNEELVKILMQLGCSDSEASND